MKGKTIWHWVALGGALAVPLFFLAVCGDIAVAPTPEDTDGSSGGDRGVGEGHDDAGHVRDSGRADGGHDTGTDAGHPHDGGTAVDAAGNDVGGCDSSCDDDTGQVADTGPTDAGTHDASVADAGHPADTGTPADTGHPADAGHPDAGASCTINTGMPACNTCLAVQCTTECTTCQGNSSCLDVLACGLACDPGDTTCLENCASAHPGGASDGANLYNCAVDHCLLQCSLDRDAGHPTDGGMLPDIGVLPDGGSVLCGLQWGSQACTTCYQSACSSQCQACAGNYDCVMAFTCIAQCPQGDMTCWNGCVSQYPGSFSLIMAMYNCANGNCKSQCGL